MVPYAALAGAAAVLMGALHARSVFVVPALAPLLFSVGVIAGVLVLAPRWGILAAAAGVLAGGILQFLFQVPAFLRRGFSIVPRLRLDDRMRRILRGWGPAVASALVFAVMQQVSFLLASGLGDGSTSAVFYAVVFFQLPLGVLSVSVVTAAFPRLAEMAANHRTAELRRSTTDGMVTLAALLVPAAVAYLLLGDSIVHAALQRRRFDAEATELTAAVLRGFAIGLPSVGVFAFLQRLCYALDAPRRALRAAIAVAVVDVALSLWWKETALGVAGLALANSAAFRPGRCCWRCRPAWWRGEFWHAVLCRWRPVWRRRAPSCGSPPPGCPIHERDRPTWWTWRCSWAWSRRPRWSRSCCTGSSACHSSGNSPCGVLTTPSLEP